MLQPSVKPLTELTLGDLWREVRSLPGALRFAQCKLREGVPRKAQVVGAHLDAPLLKGLSVFIWPLPGERPSAPIGPGPNNGVRPPPKLWLALLPYIAGVAGLPGLPQGAPGQGFAPSLRSEPALSVAKGQALEGSSPKGAHC